MILLRIIPWLLPGMIASIVLGLVVARPLGRALRARPLVAWLVVVGAGLVLSATVTPLRDALESGHVGTGGCDLSRIGLIALGSLRSINDSSLNVILFMPLGVAIGLVPAGRPRTILVVAAVASPFVIEAIQSVAPVLGRGCESADVIDNLTGLAVGLIVGIALCWLAPADLETDQASSPSINSR